MSVLLLCLGAAFLQAADDPAVLNPSAEGYVNPRVCFGCHSSIREAIRILPDYGEAHGNLAGVLDFEHDLKQALYEFNLAVRISPGDASTRFNYGAVLARKKRFEDAREQMEAAVAASPNFAEAHEMLGRLDEQKGEIDGALGEYQAAVRLRPDMSQAQLDLGAVLAKKGDLTGAAEHLRQAAASSDPTLRQIGNQLLEQIRGLQ